MAECPSDPAANLALMNPSTPAPLPTPGMYPTAPLGQVGGAPGAGGARVVDASAAPFVPPLQPPVGGDTFQGDPNRARNSMASVLMQMGFPSSALSGGGAMLGGGGTSS